MIAFVLAMQVVLSTYDGYYNPIYFTEEDKIRREISSARCLAVSLSLPSFTSW